MSPSGWKGKNQRLSQSFQFGKLEKEVTVDGKGHVRLGKVQGGEGEGEAESEVSFIHTESDVKGGFKR